MLSCSLNAEMHTHTSNCSSAQKTGRRTTTSVRQASISFQLMDPAEEQRKLRLWARKPSCYIIKMVALACLQFSEGTMTSAAGAPRALCMKSKILSLLFEPLIWALNGEPSSTYGALPIQHAGSLVRSKKSGGGSFEGLLRKSIEIQTAQMSLLRVLAVSSYWLSLFIKPVIAPLPN